MVESLTEQDEWDAEAKAARHESSFVGNEINVLHSEIFSEIHCRQIADLVQKAKHFWIPRGNNTFYTIGASTYNDSVMPGDEDFYYLVAKNNNPILEQGFGQYLAHVKAAVEKIYQREVIDLPLAGLIGFHIFDSTAVGTHGHIHTDEPFQRLFWVEPFSQPFSFTVAIALPDGRGGFDYWDREDQMFHYPYKIGHIYLHHGRMPHRISSPVQPSDENPRITIQGHGAILEDSNRVAVYF